jgi:fructokinase
MRSSVRALCNVNPLRFLRFLACRQNPGRVPALGPRSLALDERAILAAVELGGTTCVAALANFENPTEIIEIIEISTSTPFETVTKLTAWLDARTPFAALGIASFGPIDLDLNSKTYGFITTTPKPYWANFHLLEAFQHYNVPIAFDTDVNAPALAEFVHGSHGYAGWS